MPQKEEKAPPPETAKALAESLMAGDRRALAKSITLVESAREDHARKAADLLRMVQGADSASSARVGVTGTPGVGKSTFIESFGLDMVGRGRKVAVLAVDPSSQKSGGSILGDKTRMPGLAAQGNAFVRPSPGQTALGGVARKTREAILLCEVAGFDLIIIETIGVGQSEAMVAGMSDLFVLLIAPGGGDELQGVKRGIVEMSDLILVNKADGDLQGAASSTSAEYRSAIRLMRESERFPDGLPEVRTVSSLDRSGFDEVRRILRELEEWRKSRGLWRSQRKAQERARLRQEIYDGILFRLRRDSGLESALDRLEARILSGDLTVGEAKAEFFKRFESPGSVDIP